MITSTLKQGVVDAVDRVASQLTDAADFIHAHPETAYQEHQAAERLCRLLADQAIAVERGVAGLPTAFRAELRGSGPGPTVAILAEYDALPGLGHACGHNIIGTGAIGAGIALKAVLDRLPGRVLVLGTPAEESVARNSGGKIHLLEAGVFDGVDAAIMMHPAGETYVNLERSVAARGVELSFYGRAAHAAGAPWKGVNALDAVVSTYTAVSLLRQQLRPDARVHCIVLSGGEAVNIIPDFARIRYRVRADDSSYLDAMWPRVLACAEGAAVATGCRLEVDEYLPMYESTLPNPVLADVLLANLGALGEPATTQRTQSGRGSTDFGNVTRRMPGIELRLGITPTPDVPGHSEAFAEAAGSPRSHWAVLTTAKALALTAVDLLVEPGLVDRAWEAHRASDRVTLGESVGA